MFNTAQDFWKGLGSFWLHFENRSDIEAFWDGMLEALKESHKNLYKTAIGKFPKYSPDVWNHQHISIDLVWSGIEDNRINETNYFSLPNEYVGTFSIPVLSGINTGQVLTQGSDFDIIDANKLYIYDLDSRLEHDSRYTEEKRVSLFADNAYRIDPQTFHLLRTMVGTDILMPGQDVYFPFTYDGDQTLGEKVSDTVFSGALPTGGDMAVPLLNGNVMIFYYHYGGAPDAGYYVIRDPDGNSVKSPTLFESSDASYMHATRLQNGNVMLAWAQATGAGQGYLCVIDQDGNILISATAIPGISASTDEYACVTLNNGNVMIGYADVADSTKYKFVIVSPTGTAVKSATTVTTHVSGFMTATLLLNGNIMLVYYEDSTRYGEYSIYDQDGGLIKATTYFNESQTDEINVTTLNNGNVLIGFGGASDGYLMVLSPTGRIIRSATVIDSIGSIYYVSCSTLRNGTGLITFSAGDGTGRFVICDGTGNIIISSYEFAASVYDTWVVTMANGQSMIVFDDGSLGSLVVWDFVGPNGTHDYMMEKAKLIKYMTWGLFYYKHQNLGIENLEKTYNMLYNQPFAYEGGEAAVSGLECVIGEYTYYLPGGETWVINDGDTVSRFEPLTSAIEIKDRVTGPADIESGFGTLKDANAFILEVTASARSNYDTDFIDKYEEDFIDKAFNKTTTLL